MSVLEVLHEGVAAVSAAAEHAAIPEAAATPARQAADDLCAPAMDQAAVWRRQAHAARTEATTAETKLASENTALEQAEGAVARDKTALGNARDRWQQSVAEVAKQLRDMPAPVRATVPKIKGGTLPEWLREAAACSPRQPGQHTRCRTSSPRTSRT